MGYPCVTTVVLTIEDKTDLTDCMSTGSIVQCLYRRSYMGDRMRVVARVYGILDRKGVHDSFIDLHLGAMLWPYYSLCRVRSCLMT